MRFLPAFFILHPLAVWVTPNGMMPMIRRNLSTAIYGEALTNGKT